MLLMCWNPPMKKPTLPLETPAADRSDMKEALFHLGGADMTIIEQARKIRADMNAVTATL